jgi:adsorption protein B
MTYALSLAFVDALAAYFVIVREALTLAAVATAISSADDLFIDGVYLGRRAWRALFVYRRHERASADDLLAADPGWMAIVVPAWDESAVIGQMLADLVGRLDYPRYRVFVGIYPNDPATAEAVASVADSRIAAVVNPKPGPTTKADCLNRLWEAVLRYEEEQAVRFKALVLHDAEDLAHVDELKVYDHLIPRLAMVQLPVIVLPDPDSRWISGHYMDEFAESHAKDVVVREALGAGVPSAGVACAIERGVLDEIARASGGEPFDATCLTEDYELGLKIRRLGRRGAMVRIRSGEQRQIVATREHFPADLDSALRQKSRWLVGIALAGWDRLGWHGSLADRYMLLRDRKSIFTALLTILIYGSFLGVLGAYSLAWLFPAAHSFPPVVEPGSWLALLLAFNAAVLLWRLAMRMAFCAATHGWREGLRSAPRMVVGNLINLLAAMRALRRYARTLSTGERLSWDKTAHRYPTIVPVR